jgi:hypothetical protein
VLDEYRVIAVDDRRPTDRARYHESDGVHAVGHIRAVQDEWGNNHTLLIRVFHPSHAPACRGAAGSLPVGVRQILVNQAVNQIVPICSGDRHGAGHP